MKILGVNYNELNKRMVLCLMERVDNKNKVNVLSINNDADYDDAILSIECMALVVDKIVIDACGIGVILYDKLVKSLGEDKIVKSDISYSNQLSKMVELLHGDVDLLYDLGVATLITKTDKNGACSLNYMNKNTSDIVTCVGMTNKTLYEMTNKCNSIIFHDVIIDFKIIDGMKVLEGVRCNNKINE